MEEDNLPPILFGPRTGKSLIHTYPELGNEPVFKDLAKDDLLFAWYMGIKGSPIDEELPRNIRLRSACARCFPSNEEKRVRYSSDDIPDGVRAAIRKFNEYEPEARLMAKKMIVKGFLKMQQMVDVEVEKDFLYTDKDGAIMTDWTGRKQYVDTFIAISKNTTEILKQIEEGFGVTETKKSEQGTVGTKAIDRFHQSKKE